MHLNCPSCRQSLVARGPSDEVLHQCDSCALSWVPRQTLQRFVRDAVNAAGVTKKTIGFAETAPIPADPLCPSCVATSLQTIKLRGVPVLSCRTCDSVLVSRDEMKQIVGRAIEAEVGWKAAESEWAALHQRLKAEAAGDGALGLFLVLFGVPGS